MAVYTLGCRVNQYDSLSLMRELMRRGWEIVPFGEPADLVIVNSCTVTAEAERKTRKAVRHARRLCPQAFIVLMGCSAEARKQRLLDQDLPEADLVVGLEEREGLAERLSQKFGVEGPPSEADRSVLKKAYSTALLARARVPLKVQEGCDYECSYCIIRFLRGRPRSRPLDEVLKEAERLVAEGAKELVPSGTCLGLYGVDLVGKPLLPELLERLAKFPRITIRIGSLSPQDVTEELLSVMRAHPNICPHLHLPLQSGDDEILEAMRRPYRVKDFERAVDLARRCLPDIALTTDLIVGFPGEEERHFRNTVAFVKAVGFSRLHIFPYSPRPGTPAASLRDSVPGEEKSRRFEILRQLGEELSAQYRRRFLGRVVKVLAEERTRRGWLAGMSMHYVRVEFKPLGAPREDEHYEVRITGEGGEGLKGEEVKRD